MMQSNKVSRDVKIIGITGGAGSGKTEVLNILRDEYGAYIIIADEVSRNMSLKGNVSYNLIVDYFGNDILLENKEIDRQKLAAIIFNDKQKLEKLNSFIHPFVKKQIMKEIDAAKADGKWRYVVIEAALLIEDGWKAVCDELWFVHTDVIIRRKRLKETRSYTDEKIDAILSNQLSDEMFQKSCDKIVVNNSNIADLKIEILKNLPE